MIPQDLVAFLEDGVDIHLGTRDDRCVPHCAFGVGARAMNGGATLELVLPTRGNEQAIRNLEANGAAAVTLSRLLDHRSVQLKGTLSRLRAGTAEDVAMAEKWREKLAAMLSYAGIPNSILERVVLSPCVVLEIGVESLFEQTPGPGAGGPLAGGTPAPRTEGSPAAS